MTNEEFKSKNKQYVSQLISIESGLIHDIKVIVNDIAIPQPSCTLLAKLDELFETFENDGILLDQHLTVLLMTQYLLREYASTIHSYDEDVMGFFDAVERSDNNSLAYLLSMKEDLEKTWIEKDTKILNLDFKGELAHVLNSGVPLPKGITQEKAYVICNYELDLVNYKPKAISESVIKSSSKLIN